jgi:pyruvate formate lyase activating enzyme
MQAISSDGFEIDRGKCTVCGQCAALCCANSKKRVGRWVTQNDILSEIEKDRIVFANSGGGVTVGGGEPLCQPKFVTALLKHCNQMNLSTAIETCGHVKWDEVKEVFTHLNQVFMDLKCMDSAKHKALTGVGNELILENAKKIVDTAPNVTFRLPLIPGCNDSEENVAQTARYVKMLGGETRLEILAYHRLGEDKFTWMDREYALKGTQVQDGVVKERMEALAEAEGCRVVRQQ